jgi:O-antigen ligase
MLTESSRKYLGVTVLIAAFFVTVTVSPRGSLDPINLPKLCALIGLGSIALGILGANYKIFMLKSYRVPLLLLLFFSTQALIVFLIDDRDLGLKSYGIFGRSTGFLAYFFLTVLLLSTMFLGSQQFARSLTLLFIGTGSLLTIYGLIQKQGFDLYKFENLYETNVFGTLGNPNFHSALMGMTASALFFYGIFGALKISVRAFLFLIGFLALWNIRMSSEQGYLVFLASLSSGFIVYLFMKRKLLLAWLLLSASMFGGLLVGLALFNLGPASKLIYGSSIETRGFYWRAAVNLISEHPFFGVGFDAYGDWYRRGRTQEIADSNVSISADSAHNIPLDIGVSGGLPLLLVYIGIQVLVLILIVRTIRKSSEFDIYFVLAIIVWTGFQIQSLISINSLGVGIWGWVMSGLLIGYCIWVDTTLDNTQPQIKKKPIKSDGGGNWQQVSLMVISGVVGAAVAFAPYRAASNFLSALKTQNVETIVASASLKPFDRYRFLYVADILSQNQKFPDVLTLLNQGASLFPDSYEIWRQISINPSSTQEQVDIARSHLKRLDPYNPEWK